jgi:hypothetical protein
MVGSGCVMQAERAIKLALNFREGCFFQQAISGTVESAGEPTTLSRLIHPYSRVFGLPLSAGDVYFISEGV